MEAEEREVRMEMMKNLFPVSSASEDNNSGGALPAAAPASIAAAAFSEDEDEKYQEEEEEEEELNPRARHPPPSSSSSFPVAPAFTQLGKWTVPGSWRQVPGQGQKQRLRKEDRENARVFI